MNSLNLLTIDDLLKVEQFSLVKKAKSRILTDLLNNLHTHHYCNSDVYARIVDGIFGKPETKYQRLADLPFIPVSAFKNHKIKSIPDDKVYKVMHSSGTTGTSVSNIYLDRHTSRLQTQALASIVSSVVGKQRLPMLIIDSKSVYANRASYSARGAGIIGLSVFGKDHTYLLDNNFNPDLLALEMFIEKYKNQKILIFGFTFMVWKYLNDIFKKNNTRFPEALLMHSGGWKKMNEQAVSNEIFKSTMKEKFGINHVINFYGMVEQIGSVYLENSLGFHQTPNFSDIIIRDPMDFSVKQHGEEGLIQVISALPLSYPGHSLLTEDMGIILGEDDAECGWAGKYFKVTGRAKMADLRGCSDVYAN